MKFLFFIFTFSFSLMTTVIAATPNRIIGENDLVAVNADASNIPARFRPLVDAFGKMDMGCTATHIGRGYVITAGHCFWAPPELTKDVPCDAKIEWGVREGNQPYMTSTCENIVAEMRADTMDFAIIKVSPVPPVAILPDMNRRLIDGDTVTIFSHPDEMPLRWSRLCGSERIKYTELPDASVQHKCDTNPGSSGASILNILSLKIVGIHDGGAADENGAGVMNYGTYILSSPLYDVLKDLGFK